MNSSSAPRARDALLSRLTAGEFAGVWTLDPTRSTVGLRTRSAWGMVSVKGSFGEVTGEGTVAPDGNVTGSVTIGAGSIDTGNKKRDAHLRSADLLDAAQFPYILFTARELSAANADLQLAG